MTYENSTKRAQALSGWTLILAVAALPLPTGCTGGACTEVGCAEGSTLTVAGDEDPNAVAPGSYELIVEIDEELVTCPVTVPNDTDLSCFGEDGQAVSSLQAGVAITESGSIIFANLAGEPSSLTVTVLRDGVEVGGGTRTLEYLESRPNGEDCPPVCRQALIEGVTVPSTAP